MAKTNERSRSNGGQVDDQDYRKIKGELNRHADEMHTTAVELKQLGYQDLSDQALNLITKISHALEQLKYEKDKYTD